jgi:ABC-2 type transport system permease protein
MVNWKSKKLGDLLLLANGLVLIVLLNTLASFVFYRIDLTEEKRYTIKSQTKQMLKNLDDRVFVEVYLGGELNAGFTRLQKSIRETLEEFRVYSGNRVTYIFTDPAEAKSTKARGEFMADLSAKGIQPTNVIDKQNGQRVEKLIFPGALVSYGGDEVGVMFLKGNKAASAEEEINQSVEGIEFELANAIYRLANTEQKRIGLVKGQGELDSIYAAGLINALASVYALSNVSLSSPDLDNYDALVVAKPTKRFTEQDKYSLDQYLMHGGKLLLLLDKVQASMDSVSIQEYLAFPSDLDLDDLLFKYGIRLNPDLVQDQNAAFFPVVTGQSGATPRIQLIEWPFFPMINQYADHPITRNLDAVVTRFVSSIDTVKATGIKKTPLLFTSRYSRTLTAPVRVNINDIREDETSQFQNSFVPVAYLLEGKFSSLFNNRILPATASKQNFLSESTATKIIVVSDGDIARNEINPRTKQPQPLGFDPYTNYTYAHRDLILNMLAYLTDENGLIMARNKEVKIRPLDRKRAVEEKTKWQLINLALPMVLIIAYGIIRAMMRKRRYTRFS